MDKNETKESTIKDNRKQNKIKKQGRDTKGNEKQNSEDRRK